MPTVKWTLDKEVNTPSTIFLRSFYVLDTVVGTMNTAVKKTLSCLPGGVYVLQGGSDN